MMPPDETLLERLGALARSEQKAQVLSDVSEPAVAATAARVMAAMQQNRQAPSGVHALLRRLAKRKVALFVLPTALAAASVWCLVSPLTAAPHYELSVLHAGGVLRGGSQQAPGERLQAGRVELLLRPDARVSEAPQIRVWREGHAGLVVVEPSIERDPSGAARVALEVPEDTRSVMVALCEAAAGQDCEGQRWRLLVAAP